MPVTCVVLGGAEPRQFECVLSLYRDFALPSSVSYNRLCAAACERLQVLLTIYEHHENGERAQSFDSEVFDPAAQDWAAIAHGLLARALAASSARYVLRPEAAPDAEASVRAEAPVQKRRLSLRSAEDSAADVAQLRRSAAEQQALADDKLSLLVLLLAFADPAAASWLLRQEVRYFALKLAVASQGFMNDTVLKLFVREFALPLTLVQTEDAEPAGRRRQISPKYCVPFGEGVVDFLNAPNVSLFGGSVTFPPRFLCSYLVNTFAAELGRLQRWLATRRADAAEALADERELQRLLAFLGRFRPYDAVGLGRSADALTAEQCLTLATLHEKRLLLPPCMLALLQQLVVQRHLKYGARLQLWPFLKDAGMSLHEQVLFARKYWQDQRQFEREMLYNLRYIYGLEGHKQERSCYSCAKLVAETSVSSVLVF